MTRKFTFLLMALLALTGLQGWANPVVSSPSGSNDRETYNIAIADLTQNRWDFFCSTSAEEGSTVQVSYSPVTGYETYEPHVICEITGTHESIDISDFTDAGDYYYANFTMPDNNVTVTASFEPSGDLYNVHPQTPFTGGTVNIDQINNLSEGTMVKMWVTPDTQNHYTFDVANYQHKISVKYGENLSQSVTVSAYSNYYFFYMPAADVTVDVIFDEEPNHTITVNNPEGCTITVLSEPKYYEGREIYFEYELASGYRFNSWNVKYDDGVHMSPQSVTVYDNKPWNGDYYFIMPEGPVTITANVTQVATHTITVVQPAVGGTISVSTTEAATGDPVYIYTYPAQGYTLNKWYVKNENGDVVLEDVTAGFYMPDFNVTVTATFIKPETLTVFGNGGPYDYNSIYPVYTYWGDTYGTTSQFIIPAEELEDMVGGTIKGMKFFISSGGQTGNQIWECRIKEVDDKALTGIVDVSTLTPVYSGHYLSFANNEWNVTFDTPFAYSGKNLLVSFQCTTEGSYKSNSFYGEKVDYYASWSSREGGSTFIPKTEFTYFPDPTAVFYNIEIAQVEGGTITASKTRAKADTEIELSVNLEEGYTFSRWIVTDGDGTIAVTDNQFTMRTSNVTVTAEYNALPRYNVTLVQSAGGSITATPCENVLEGKWVKLVATPDHGYRFVSWSGSTEAGETLHIATVATSGFTMRASNATVTATFETLPTYEVNYYANGSLVNTLNPYEGEDVDITPCEVPAGVNFYGWATSEINENPYLTAAPSVITAGTPVNADMNLYAVFKYAEEISLAKGGDTWMKITSPSELIDGQEIVLVYNNSYVMGERQGQYSMNYYRYAVSVADDKISNLPSSATIFTLEQSSGKWKLHYNDFGTPTTLSYNTNDGLANYGLWLEFGCYSYDEWTAEGTSNVIFRNNYNYEYIGEDESEYSYLIHSVADASLACQAYKKGTIVNNYYMTSVLTGGTVADATVKNIIVINPITVSGRLEMNANGLFRNEDAAKFVFEDGAQLIYDGDETVNATMKKDIAGTNWYTISSPLANSVEFAEVENLIPSSGVTGTDYDLYRFDEANSIWVNSRVWQNNEPNTTIIANPNFKTIDKGLGYIYANEAGAELEFKGEINVADVENVNLTMTADKGKGFNLIGNPFAQNIKMTDVEAGTAVLAGGFYVLNNDNTWATEPITTGTIAPLQGFLVQATTAGTATISKPTAAPSKGERSEQNTNIEMIVSNSIYRDNAYAMFGEGIGLNKVNHRNAEAPMLYIPQSGEDFAIAFMNENTTLFPLNFKAMTTGKYSISLKATDDINTLVLVDNMTGVETNMLLESSYSFIGSPADKENRFTVKLGISHNDSNENEQFVYQYGNELIIDGEGTLQVFDVLGRVVISEEVHGQRVDVSNLTKGAYIVRMTGNEVKTQKIIVR